MSDYKVLSRLGILSILLAALGFSLAPASVSAKQAREPSVAYKMAAIDCQCTPSAGTVAQYQRLLVKLVTRKCREKPLKLANELANVRHMFVSDGYGTFTYGRLLRLLDRSIPNSINFKQSCASVLAALVVLIEHK
jgi:hypothetical protein